MVISCFDIRKKWLFMPLLALCWGCGSHRHAQVPMEVAVPVTTTISPVQQQDVQPATSVVSLTPEEQWRQGIIVSLDSLCKSSLMETSQLGLYVYDLTAGQSLYEHNIRHRMRPASCQKLITAISALHFLGGDYQFNTRLCITGNVNGGVLNGDAYIIGGMDPVLGESTVSSLVAGLKSSGISRIAGNVYMDCSMKDDKEYGWGWCWDDDYGPLSALMVNAKASFPESWNKVVAKAGIRQNNSKLTERECPAGAQDVISATTSIDQVLKPMLKKSDNIYAESMFYALAASTGRKHAGRKDAAQRINELIEALGLAPSDYQIADGSGLSLYNYVTPQLFVTLLNYAISQEGIRSHLLDAMPIAGVDGTLEKRMIGTPAAGNVHAKTGTVTGISSLSGVLTAGNGHVITFSIINQGVSSGSEGRSFQDKVCVRLCQ